MVLDRVLTPELLDFSLVLARSPADPDERRVQLRAELRRRVSLKEADGKTKTCLRHAWLAPPTPARPMIAWALATCGPEVSRPLLHYGALLATYPFFGVVAGVIGRELALGSEAPQAAVRRQVCRLLGDRSTIDVGARKVYTTIRLLGLVRSDGLNLRLPEPVVPVPAGVRAWMAHAVLLTRQSSALDVDELPSAPELFPFTLSGPALRDYSLLQVHAEGGSRRVLTTSLAS